MARVYRDRLISDLNDEAAKVKTEIELAQKQVSESEVAVTVAARSAFRPLAPYGRSTERDSAR